MQASLIAAMSHAVTARPNASLRWGTGPVKMHLSVCSNDACKGAAKPVLDYAWLGTYADQFDGTCDTLDDQGLWDSTNGGGFYTSKFYWNFENGFDPSTVDPKISCGDGTKPVWDLKCPFIQFFEQPYCTGAPVEATQKSQGD